MRVVVDTNAFYSDLTVRGPLRVLVSAARRGDFVLVVPEVVVQEVLKRFRVRYGEELRRYENSAKALTDLTIGQFDADSPPGIEEASVRYEAHLRDRLHAANASIPGPPSVTHDDILQRAISRRKPFKENGSGYQDTLIWLSVLEESELDHVTLITANTSDFGERVDEAWVLASDLREDLLEAGQDRGDVTLCLSVRDFIEAEVTDEEQDVEKFRDALLEDPERRATLESRIANAVRGHSLSERDEVLRSAEVESATVVSVAIQELKIDDVYEFEDDDDDTLYVTLVGKATADVEFELPATDADRLPRDERAMITLWMEGIASGRKRMDVKLWVDVLLDDDLGVVDVEITDVTA